MKPLHYVSFLLFSLLSISHTFAIKIVFCDKYLQVKYRPKAIFDEETTIQTLKKSEKFKKDVYSELYPKCHYDENNFSLELWNSGEVPIGLMENQKTLKDYRIAEGSWILITHTNQNNKPTNNPPNSLNKNDELNNLQSQEKNQNDDNNEEDAQNYEATDTSNNNASKDSTTSEFWSKYKKPMLGVSLAGAICIAVYVWFTKKKDANSQNKESKDSV